ncbi:ribose-5-phosphate isomerase RpiA [Polynucleobacter sp. IMCC30063]|uniref:ribose-5-phosphate isomerase RpiA n=1 Tax=unclassified Polynucleobacter TaxID=2640945 RepID=UPI001F2D0AFB|nr:ribose-5-phosphate isomerase RpiA [Polynucleobacter sp. IMCC30063]MCE7527162.1 ribose-5-phosphate isomerase RpiA [Polynucleobacter sp. IMCC 30228]MCE7528981.1 ribose-5-phosphate isomerase RpiA [Polynucleobacter sp. IMCC 29146]
MNPEELKRLVAQAACDEVLKLPAGQCLGIGTGSTANWFIDLLAPHRNHFAGVVSSSIASTQRLIQQGFYVFDTNQVADLPVYVDGADEINPQGHMIKGGGGALTREKIIAAMAKRFICICDASKQVAVLGRFPLPLEIIPMAEPSIRRTIAALGGDGHLRMVGTTGQPFMTDNGGWIVDVHGLSINQPVQLELQINQIPGVVSVGLFAQRKADLLLVGSATGVAAVAHSQ